MCVEQGIRDREAFASLTQPGGCGGRSFGSFGQELFDGLVSVVAVTDFHQAGKVEFYSSFDFDHRTVVATRFQTLRRLFGTAERAPEPTNSVQNPGLAYLSVVFSIDKNRFCNYF
jgi:hypothetical protein